MVSGTPRVHLSIGPMKGGEECGKRSAPCSEGPVHPLSLSVCFLGDKVGTHDPQKELSAKKVLTEPLLVRGCRSKNPVDRKAWHLSARWTRTPQAAKSGGIFLGPFIIYNSSVAQAQFFSSTNPWCLPPAGLAPGGLRKSAPVPSETRGLRAAPASSHGFGFESPVPRGPMPQGHGAGSCMRAMGQSPFLECPCREAFKGKREPCWARMSQISKRCLSCDGSDDGAWGLGEGFGTPKWASWRSSFWFPLSNQNAKQGTDPHSP